MHYLITFLTALLVPGVALAADQQTLSFDAFLGENNHIGQHYYSIRQMGGNQYKVRSRCRFDVDILFFNAYSYNHHAEETWKDGCIHSLESKTIERGETTYVKGERKNGVFTWQVNGGPAQSTSDCVRTFAYWHPTYLLEADKLMNPQTGEIKKVNITSEDVSGAAVKMSDPGKQIRITGDELDIKIWYTDALKWLGLTSEVDGNQLNYKRVDDKDESYENLF